MYELIQGDCIESMKKLEAGTVQTCVTSPPYYSLRDYGHEGQIGLEETPDAYVAKLVDVFREVRRLLRDDGTLWLNLGDSYFSPTKGDNRTPEQLWRTSSLTTSGGKMPKMANPASFNSAMRSKVKLSGEGLKPKDLIGIPWLVAFALRADGWYLRSDIIWHKPNPMPESVTDRPTKAHEYIFLLSKSREYFYDADAIKEESKTDLANEIIAGVQGYAQAQREGMKDPRPSRGNINGLGSMSKGFRNKRSVWTVTTKPFTGWTKTSRQVPVVDGELSDGMKHKVSPSCQLHGYLCRQDSTQPYDVRAIGELIHNARNGGNHAQAQQGDSVPTDPNREQVTPAQSLDLPSQSHLPFATDHNNQSHKTGHDPLTIPPYTPSVQSPSHTERKSEQPALSGQGRDNGGYSISVGESGDSQGNRNAGDTVDIPVGRELYGASVVSLKDSGCMCSFYHTITEETSHFATFPPDLIEPCILAGSKPGDTVLDPFSGSGTTGAVSLKHGRHYIGLELNAEYIELAHRRIIQMQPMLLGV